MRLQCFIIITFTLQFVIGNKEASYNVNSDMEYIRFITEPTDTIILSPVDVVKLICEAMHGNESITYTWYKHTITDYKRMKIENGKDYRYVDGGLEFNIDFPSSLLSGNYQCLAHSSTGSILSRTATLTIAYAQPLSTSSRKPIRSVLYGGAVIDAGIPILAPPDLEFTWMKSNTTISPTSPRTFISRDGHLYFSEVQESDAGVYVNHAQFRKIPGDVVYLGNVSYYKVVSKPIHFEVISNNFSTHEVNFVNLFPNVFPRQPKIGQTIEMECFAFGSLPITYSWTMTNDQVTNRTTLSEGNRRLTIVDVRYSDEGNYTCSIIQNGTVKQSRTINLKIRGRPLFSLELYDLAIKSNAFHKLECMSSSSDSTIKWYKDGEPIGNITNRYHTYKKTLIIFTPTIGRDDGLYQCEAQNNFGVSYSTALVTITDVSQTDHSSKNQPFSLLILPLLSISFIYIP